MGPKGKWSKRMIQATLATVLCFNGGGVIAGSASVANAASVPPTPTATLSDPDLVAITSPSIVAIIGKPNREERMIVNNRFNLAHGTGVIVTENGYILTNAHVVKDIRNITVVTSDGKTFSGKMTHIDEDTDLALVKIETSGLKPATFADPTDIRVGEHVLAIGTPGEFQFRNSVTSGLVSGVDRAVKSGTPMIQTDAAINPGNSGGALVNARGQVIGINTLKFMSFGMDSLGFAIPIKTVQYVMDHFFKYGSVKRPYIGIEFAESWEAVIGLPTNNGLTVLYVEADSPAAKAGIKKGDELMSIGGKKTNSMIDYQEAMRSYLPGQNATLAVRSGGSIRNIDVTTELEVKQSSKTKVNDDKGIDPDSGKTKLGNSKYGWTMTYPSDLVAMPSDSGKSVMLGDTKSEFMMAVRVEDNQPEGLSPYSLLKGLETRSRDTIIQRQYKDRGPVPYAEIISRSEGSGFSGSGGGSYTISRTYYKNNTLYTVSLTVGKEENYKSNVKRNSFIDLLDSFTLSFDSSDTSIKDFANEAGPNVLKTKYGVVFNLPSDWVKGYGEGISFSNKERDKRFNMRVTSLASGDSLSSWETRQSNKVMSLFNEGYREVGTPTEVDLKGVPALQNSYSTTMGDKWRTTRVLRWVKDKYKYEFSFSFAKSDDEAEVNKAWDTAVQAIQWDKDNQDRFLGWIQDEDEVTDYSKLIKYVNKKYKYSLMVPEPMYGLSSSSSFSSRFMFDDDDLFSGYYGGGDRDSSKTFSINGGSLSFSADDATTLAERLTNVDAGHRKNKEVDANYNVVVTDEEMFDGLTVKHYSLSYKSRNVPYTLDEYYFAYRDVVYTIRLRINDAVKTDEQLARLNAIMNSFTWVEEKDSAK